MTNRRAWDALTPQVQQVLLLASEQAHLWELCLPSQVVGPDSVESVEGLDPQVAKELVAELIDQGHVAIYHSFDEQTADLTAKEVREALASDHVWQAGGSASVTLYLTPEGERFYYSPDRE